MEIQILNTTNNIVTFVPVIGDRTIELLGRLSQNIDADEIEVLKKETSEILSFCSNPHISEVQSVTNLVVGYVQSGKTMSFTTLSAMAVDNGFRMIIYFAGTKNNLLDQTTKRLRKDLMSTGQNMQYYKLHENPNKHDIQRIDNELKIQRVKPVILITVLKNAQHINELADILSSQQLQNTLGKQGVLIIDDEADQASLNGYAYKNSKAEEWEDDEYTATYSSILRLKSKLPNHSYIQYTATPQGPLLINIVDLLSPKHHTVLTPGKNYTGGKTFFKDEPGLIITIPDSEVYHSKHNNLTECPQSLVKALQLHLMSVAIVVRIKKKEPHLSMMVHADKEQDASEKFYNWVANLIQTWASMIEVSKQDLAYQEMYQSFCQIYPEAIKEYQAHNEEFPSFAEIWEEIPDIVHDTNIALLISRNKVKDIDWTCSPSHILVGAEMLNRGFTVDRLAITYMPRHSIGKSTADTIQQRCRFFGYKRNYLYSCRVFLPEDTILEYVDYVEHEEEMRQWLKENKDLTKVEQLLIISPHLNATRKNILSKNTVTTKLNGWRQMNTFQCIEENTLLVNQFIQQHKFTLFKDYNTADRNHRYIKLPIKEVIQFLSEYKCQNMPDSARKQATLRYINYLSNNEPNPLQFAYIIQMAYDGEARERSFDPETQRIKNLHSGRSNSGALTYPGDKQIRFEDSICIQIHYVKLKCDSMQWCNLKAYTLAIYYPEDFAINYVNTEK
ncbi:MAG: endonuclease [Bacteroidales bacterium]|nr:endonuclease [Bacteroidales bacterium]